MLCCKMTGVWLFSVSVSVTHHGRKVKARKRPDLGIPYKQEYLDIYIYPFGDHAFEVSHDSALRFMISSGIFAFKWPLLSQIMDGKAVKVQGVTWRAIIWIDKKPWVSSVRRVLSGSPYQKQLPSWCACFPFLVHVKCAFHSTPGILFH
ncbi:uncharacterized protein LOC130137494 [Syzygium oleosum]|uniref:uncharacterized protein LOC130137494 n=1 Tax=Syzygium oleosum TaxID=219896 RepID=UPI0024B88DBD|nr:uncharacterized protein LOC130137494 [Syzygium oleosum]